jgi:pyruvate,water dikinase
MIPFVIRTRELREAKKIMRDIGLEPCEDIEFGVMIETPASCWIIDELIKEGISFISFGTNDLTQLTLGVDRNNERIAKLFDEMHHAVLGEMAMVIRACKKAGVETSICGQAGSRPEMAKFLVKEGIDSISANPDAVQEIREVVARTERALMLEAEREEMERR